jgi:hypothetical protein
MVYGQDIEIFASAGVNVTQASRDNPVGLVDLQVESRYSLP